ncbi:type VII secretion protein EccCa [Schumannella soli]|uniref:Type VII secretion protein EccCa n=1 Tax=Schumannella soli TaxID=2590779 RepID=A0A506Y750_9MICO|nr:type VII secretion protein EccCa [Schumannella soli]TPW77845.1 type VII secretion protein EccCa [Schumannella soli]
MSRGPRLAPPRVPSGTVQVQPPPELAPSEGAGGVLMSALPMLGSIGSIVMITFSQQNATGLITGGMFLLSSLGFVAVNGWRQRSQRAASVLENRREYLAYLKELRDTVRTAARQQRRHGNWVNPAPSVLPFMADERTRVWERSGGDDDFLHTRIGVADQPLCITLEAPDLPPLAQLDPVAASAAHRFMLTHEVQPRLPLAVDLGDYARVEVTGADEEAVRSLARSMVLGLATLHDPESLQIAVLAGPAQLPLWEWTKWLPHTHSVRSSDRLGAARMIGADLADLEDLLPADLRERPRFVAGGGAGREMPHVLLLVDGARLPNDSPVVGADGMQGVTVLDLPARWNELDDALTLRLALAGDVRAAAPAEVVALGRLADRFTPDTVSIAEAEATARRLMPLANAGAATGAEVALSGQAELVELLGMPDVREIDYDRVWSPRLERDRLRVPIGQDTNGVPLVLDIKEAAQQGMGPHGVLIGATGSGKSEVLRTLVLALALTHSSEQLNFVLVDFKGGATFAGMADMPHVSAIITNLGSELALVDRFQDALQGEVVRRQELLRAAGNFANVSDYEKARRGGRTDLAPLPALLIVADEFSELLAAKPEFVESFVNIGRVGRSLQVHLLLASQRLEEGKLRGLDTYLSYRIGLRTFSAAESRTVIGVPDAYTLPQEPGVGLLKVGTDELVQFRAAYVSGAPPRRRITSGSSGGGPGEIAAEIEIFTAAATGEEPEPEVDPDALVQREPEEERSTFQIAVDRMAGKGPEAHQVWLPPLKEPPSLDQLMSDLVVDPQLGLVSPSWRAAGGLTVPLGIVDVPLEQRRERLTVTLGGAAGHAAIVGGPLSGKSTMARSLVTSLSLTASPLELQFYVLDFGGGTFTGLQKLPHVAGVATRTEQESVRRTVAEVQGIIDAREIYFRENGIDSIDTYRLRRSQGVVDDGYGDVFLIVDGWSTLRTEYELLEPTILTIAARGLSFGVHLIVTANRWLDIRSNLKDLIQTRLELRLGDPSDSEIARKAAINVPAGQPGRGLAPGGLQMLGAVPRIDGIADAAKLVDGVDDLIARISAAWTGPRGPKLRLLPKLLSLEEARQQAGPQYPRLLLGVDEQALAPFGIDPRSEPHLFLYGDAGTGKSSFLRGIAQEITRLYGPNEAKLFVVDYRRALLGELPQEYVGAYLTSHEMATGGMAELSAFFSSRIPGADVTPDQLRERSWWKGAEGFILIDDYDLVATSQGNPIAVLQPLLAQAGDLGLHVILTRRSGGASRAAYDPIIQRFTDLGVTGILLGGNPEEGALIGRVKPIPSEPGRAQVVSRERGLITGQLVYSPPSHA